MNILLEDIVYITYNIFRIYIICQFAEIFFKELKTSIKWKYILLLIYIFVSSIVYFIADKPILNLFINFIMYMLFSFVYKSTVYVRLFSFILIYILSTIYEGGTYFIIQNLNLNIQQTLILTYISTDVCMFITEEIIRGIFKKERYYNVESKYNFLLFVIPIGSLYLCINILNTNDISLDNILSIFILLSINLSVFYILSLIIKSYERIYKQDMIKSEYKYYKNQLELIQDSNNKTAKIRHDYKNHMIALKNYINNGKQKEIDVYIDSVLDNLKPSNIIIDSGNFVIDSLLNYKIGCIDNLNYKIDVKVPKRIFVSDYDINILLGNLLDNAINALENDHEKILNISIIYKYESLYIKFCNSYSGYYKKKGNSFITTKDDKLNHGYGLKNIEEIVHKYSGNIEYYTDNNKFIVDIILCQNN